MGNRNNIGQIALAVALIVSALILLYAISHATDRVSDALVQAGQQSKPNVHVPSSLRIKLADTTRVKLDTDTLKVALAETEEVRPAFKLQPADRERITQLFQAAVQGKTDLEGRMISKVDVASTTATADGKLITIIGTLHFQSSNPQSRIEPLEYYSRLSLDGFGDFAGNVYELNSTRSKKLLSDVYITLAAE